MASSSVVVIHGCAARRMASSGAPHGKRALDVCFRIDRHSRNVARKLNQSTEHASTLEI